MGDDAWLKRIWVQIRSSTSSATSRTFTGEVIEKRIEDGEYQVVCDFQAINQLNEITTPGQAIILLPSRAAGNPQLPTGNQPPYPTWRATRRSCPWGRHPSSRCRRRTASAWSDCRTSPVVSEQLVPAPALLDGVSAVEYGQSAAIGFAGRLLADLGVTVTKIEPPEGDRTRFEGFTAPGADSSALFAYANAGKRSVVIDDTTPEGRDDLARLLASAEIVLDGHEAEPLGRDRAGLRRAAGQRALPPGGLADALRALRRSRRLGGHAPHRPPHRRRGVRLPRRPQLAALPGPRAGPRPSRVAELDAGTAAGVTMLGWLAGDRDPAVVELSWQEAAMTLSRQDIVKWPNDGFIDTRATRQIPVLGLVECLDGWVEIYPSEQHMWERLVLAVDSPSGRTLSAPRRGPHQAHRRAQ